jgi:thiosulfate/3-mercaptopyruvate sulfurtransferase
VRTLLLDCRPEAAHRVGRPPGALHVEPERDLSDPVVDAARGGRHPLPSAERLAALFRRLGVDQSTFVLACDEGSGWAARCWWLLRQLGHDAAGTLDLRAYAGLRETGTPAPEGEGSRGQPSGGVARVRRGSAHHDDVIEMDEIRARLHDPSLILLDARAPERWRGDSEPLDPVAGRIPGARNAPFDAPLPDGLPADGELAVYCGSGVTACVVAQRLVLAGHRRVRMYPGSFSEWCRHPDNPIERGST